MNRSIRDLKEDSIASPTFSVQAMALHPIIVLAVTFLLAKVVLYSQKNYLLPPISP